MTSSSTVAGTARTRGSAVFEPAAGPVGRAASGWWRTVEVMQILDLDLAAFENGSPAAHRAVVNGMMRSLGTSFVYVKHGLSETFLDDVYGTLEKFFALDQAAKSQYVVDGSFGSRGYTGLLVETAAGESRADWKEMLNWGGSVPGQHPLRRAFPHQYLDPVLPERDLPGSFDLLMGFHATVADLQRRVLRVIAAGVGVHEEFFDEMVVNGPTLTRAIHYPSMLSAPGEEHVWAAAHVDINLITALPRATEKGLQLRIEDRWVDVLPPAGHMVVNTGIMLERLTNGLVQAGWHRVVSQGPGERFSIVQFCHPTPWTMLQPVPSCVSPGRPLRYPTVSAASALEKVLWDINLVPD